MLDGLLWIPLLSAVSGGFSGQQGSAVTLHLRTVQAHGSWAALFFLSAAEMLRVSDIREHSQGEMRGAVKKSQTFQTSFYYLSSLGQGVQVLASPFE